MKILIAVATLATVATSALSEPPTSEPSAPGRYQVAMGKLEYSVPLPSGRSQDSVINTAIMIDTATGRTWFLESIMRQAHDKTKDGGPIFVPDRRWSEIKLKE